MLYPANEYEEKVRRYRLIERVALIGIFVVGLATYPFDKYFGTSGGGDIVAFFRSLSDAIRAALAFIHPDLLAFVDAGGQNLLMFIIIVYMYSRFMRKWTLKKMKKVKKGRRPYGGG